MIQEENTPLQADGARRHPGSASRPSPAFRDSRPGEPPTVSPPGAFMPRRLEAGNRRANFERVEGEE